MESYLIIGTLQDCDTASSSLMHELGIHPKDVFHLLPNEKNVITIEMIRVDLSSFLASTPLYGTYHAANIHQAETMTVAAQNALLKTLEEPPPSARIVLTSDAPQKLLGTIISRCTLRYCDKQPDVQTEPAEQTESLLNPSTTLSQWMNYIDTHIRSREEAALALLRIRTDILALLYRASTDDSRLRYGRILDSIITAEEEIKTNAAWKACLDTVHPSYKKMMLFLMD